MAMANEEYLPVYKTNYFNLLFEGESFVFTVTFNRTMFMGEFQ